jgi:hypothetical protein
MKTKTCSSHCRTCGRHFAGDGAFDRHRAGDPKKGDKGLDGRHCTNPENDKFFEAVTGDCRIAAPGSPGSGITIWRRAGCAERLAGLGQ